MTTTCIVTDSTAQFPQLGFSGRNDIRVIPFSISLNGKVYEESRQLKPSDLPASTGTGLHPRLIPPTVEDFQALYLTLSQRYSDIVAIMTSARISDAFEHARQAAEGVRGRVNISIIDSQTISVGLALLVQSAAEAAAAGYSSVEVERLVRSLTPHIYMVLCTPGLSYLSHAGIVDPGQAFAGEMLGLLPIFTLEEGQMTAVEKVRNTRALVDFLQEFVCEFDDLEHIAFIQSQPALSHEARLMREHAQTCFPNTPFSENTINLALATLFGPRTVGLVVSEKPDPA